MSAKIESDVAELVARARAAGIELWTEGHRLRFRAPRETMSGDLHQELKSCRESIVMLLRDEAAQRIERGSLAENQRGLWFLSELVPDSAAYNLAFSAHAVGGLDVNLLRETLQILIDRHASLRSSYPVVDGEPERHVAGYMSVELEEMDARNLPADQLLQRVKQDYARPFDLHNGPLVRASVYKEGDERHLILLTVHHIAVDGTGLSVLIEDFIAIYSALSQGTPVPLTDYATYDEFVAWQKSALLQSEAEAAYWSDVLEPFPTALDLPHDRHRSGLPTMRGNTVMRVMDSELAAAVRQLARAYKTTEYAVLLSLWFVLLHRLTGNNDITVGTPVLGRPSVRFERTVGDFINMLPLRVRDMDGLEFSELVRRVRTVVLEGLARQDFPLPRMVEQQSVRAEFTKPPFQTLFVLQDFSRFPQVERLLIGSEDERIACGAITLSPYPINQQEGQFELGLEVWSRGDELVCAWRFDVDVFDASTIERLAGHFAQLLRGAVEAPDTELMQLPLLSEAERERLLYAFNETSRAYPGEQTVLDLFAAQVARCPERTAVVFEGDALSYGELDTHSNQLARHLESLGVGPGELVGLGVERGLDMVVGLLGILKTGAAYVPLDPGFPAERLRYMVEDSGAQVLVTETALDQALFAELSVRRVYLDGDRATIERQSGDGLAAALAEPAALAYVIYTSGSTGRPKGVAVPHQALMNFLGSMAVEPGLGETDVLVAVTTISFDIAGLELFLPLTVGARVALAGRDTALDPVRLGQLLTDSGATVMQATPATWRMLVDAGWSGNRHLKILCGGEALTQDLAQRLLPVCDELWNLYGPTETTVWSSVARVESADDVTIGRPIANTRIYVLDAHRQPVPVGIVGELWIGGDGVAHGYLGQPELTAERFIEDPFSPGRMYRTGDLARYLPDGRLECLGRTDNQVKIRGYRIELGEIEAALAEHPDVIECAVVAWERAGDHRLVAYVVGAHDATTYREHLRTRLPEYMIPSVFMFMSLGMLPRTANNKIDRKALPAPDVEAFAPRQEHDPPADEAETAIAEVWQKVLQVKRVGRHDNFYDLGGHSLLAVKVVSRIEKRLGVRINPFELNVQTLCQLAASCNEQLATGNNQRQPGLVRRLLRRS